jgi:FAD:protein FMN transferase
MDEPYRFQSMGCEVVVAGAGSAERAAIERLFHARDAMFSRFRSDSELNRVNRAAGAPVLVSGEFAEMLDLACAAARESDGLVDPTFGAELVAAGYDIDFGLLARDGASSARRPGGPRGWEAVRRSWRHVVVPRGAQLDLNGVVKGRTVDHALALLRGEGFVSAGGDVAVRGSLVASLPRGGTVKLVQGALATSGTDRRRWLRDGEVRHHLIDPRTRTPAMSPWEQVTVCSRTCLGADVAAKAAFLLGPAGPDWLDARGLPGRFVAADGDVSVNRAWQHSLELAVACI